jgi:hypothetical protein
MLPCDQFITDNIEPFKEFIDRITSEDAMGRASYHRMPRFDLKHNTAVMARIYSKYLPELYKKQHTNVDGGVAKLLPMLLPILELKTPVTAPSNLHTDKMI